LIVLTRQQLVGITNLVNDHTTSVVVEDNTDDAFTVVVSIYQIQSALPWHFTVDKEGKIKRMGTSD